MFGLFKKKIVLGEMSIIFPNQQSAFVSDSIPKAMPGSLPEIVCDLWFAMMFMGKLLNNFPGSSGAVIAQEAFGRLEKKYDNDQAAQIAEDDLFPNISFLGLFLPNNLELLKQKPKSGKLYRGTFFQKGDNFLVDTKIALGDEPYYHCATLDVMLETERVKLGDKGNTLVTAVAGYLPLMIKNGASDLVYNLRMAASSAMLAASKVTDLSSL